MQNAVMDFFLVYCENWVQIIQILVKKIFNFVGLCCCVVGSVLADQIYPVMKDLEHLQSNSKKFYNNLKVPLSNCYCS